MTELVEFILKAFYFLLLVTLNVYSTLTPAYAGNILVLGDSLSAAHNIPLENGWVHLLQNRLDEAPDNQWKVINASISGETSSGGLARLPGLVEEHQPDLCILELGANDGLRGLSVGELKSNLESMINLCQEKVLLLEIWLPPNFGERYLNRFRAVYKELAQQYQLTLVPFFLQNVADNPDLMQEDGLHPNSEGQPIILDNIWQFLESILQAPPPHN